MNENNEYRRSRLAIELLLELKKVYSQLDDASKVLEKCSDEFYDRLYNGNKSGIETEINKYRSNIAEISRLNSEITTNINSWYSFIKSTEELSKITFPLSFYFKKKKLKNCIKKINQTISEITIENRFIREQLTMWEHKLELDAIQLIKQGNNYTDYEQLIKKRDALALELRYLLPTIQDICPVELSLSTLDILIEKLSSIAAA